MDALQPSFMLLPNFTYLPNHDSVQLGSIIAQDKDTHKPDPSRPLNEQSRQPPANVSTQSFKPWKWDSSDKASTSAGVWADLSILTGIGGGLKGEGGHVNGLKIKCEEVVVTSCTASPPQFIAKSLDDDFFRKLFSRKLSRPCVYMVTGVMVAHKAEIVIERARNYGAGIHGSVDVTSTGVPLDVGAGGEYSRDRSFKLAQVPSKPFVLAYQLVRIRKKFDGALEDRNELKWALFNDNIGLDVESADTSLADLEFDLVTPNTE